MKLIVALCLVAVVVAAPPPRTSYSNNDVQITKYENDNLAYGRYRYIFEQTDGQRAEQAGEVQNEGREDEALSVVGSYSWVGPDGVTYIVRYTSGVQGYKPEIEQGPGGGVPSAVLATLVG